MSNKKDLLIEIGTEDLPARLLPNLSDEFGELVCDQLRALGLSFSQCETFSTPRRIAILVNELECKQKDQLIERKGPKASSAFDKNGKPTKAALGFARSCNIEADQLELDDNSENPRLVYREKQIGKDTHQLIPSIIETAVKNLPLPKRMRWNQSNAEFIRPIRWLVVLLGKQVIATDLFGIQSSNRTNGHRFHHAEELVIEQPSEYKTLLCTKGYVIANFAERQNLILEQVSTLANQVNGKPSYTQSLLDEITGLVEWPFALLGEFDEKFLSVHKELLISTMQDNQKYIPLLGANDELLSKFIIVSNIESKNRETVKHGNEKVIVPRFEDAMFFWQRDKQINLEDNLNKLDSVVYEKQLGTLKDKTERIKNLSSYLSQYTSADMVLCERAAILSKCDLITQTVSEFPKLQGVTGRNLASQANEDPQVCTAIEEQYMPKQAGSVLPSSKVGITLALADRLDSLIGIFAIGKKPSGLKDPYGLRRSALAVLRIIIETPLNINLLECLKKAASLYPKALNASAAIEIVSEYINERYRAYFTAREIPVDVIDAVLANNPTHPSNVAEKVEALMNFRKLPNAEALAAANKRIRNILKKIDHLDVREVDTSLFKEDAERSLHSAIENLANEVEKLFADHNYEQALNKLADLREPVDHFFDDVMVMDEDEALKTNRIALLSNIDSLFMQIADFSRLQS